MNPIFIVGCQRSGSTLLASLLGVDPATISVPEAQFVADLAPGDVASDVNLGEVIDQVTRHQRFAIWKFDLGRERPEGRGQYASAIRWLVREYARACGKPDPERWIDHQPGHVREMAVLRLHFPNLRAIHIVRDGRAVAASLMALNWGPNGIQSAARFWAQRIAMGQALRRWLGPDQYIETRYEDLVSNPEHQLRPLCDFLSIPYANGMIDGTGFKVPAFTRDQHALVGTRPDATRIDAWREQLSAREIEIFEALVGPLLTYLGYTRMFEYGARLPSLREGSLEAILGQWRAIRNAHSFRRNVKASVASSD